jgi:hypothetical protein
MHEYFDILYHFVQQIKNKEAISMKVNLHHHKDDNRQIHLLNKQIFVCHFLLQYHTYKYLV